MATAIVRTAEDQITCTICYEILQEPKALPCLHTFCRECIRKYIIERNSQHQNRNGYPCPVCRRHVSVPARIKHNPQVWADWLENNHALRTMIDAYKTPRGVTKETCEDHPGKKLDFFCTFHSRFICTLCRPQHRRCNSVITKEEASNCDKMLGKQTSNTAPDENDMLKHMDCLFDQCNFIEHMIDQRRAAMEFLDQSEKHVREELMTMRMKLNELMSTHTKGTPGEMIQASEQTNIQRSEESQSHQIILPCQRNPSWTTGLAVLPSGKLLVVDHTNGAVSVFSFSLDFLCQTNINPAPYDVVSISSTQDLVMISIPDTTELVKYEVLQDGAVESGRKLKTNIECKAVASDGRHVAVCSNSELQIFEMDDELWMVLLDESYETTKFTYITMTSEERKVFITNQSYSAPHTCIMCFDFDGATLWKVTDDRISCTGICVVDTQLMVTSWDSGKLYTLSFNGGDLKRYNTGITVCPWKLHVSKRKKIICVSQYKTILSEEDKRTIKIFQMA